jgi:hypothetical protein
MIKLITALLPTTVKRVVGSRTSADLKADLAKLVTEAEGIEAHREKQIAALDETLSRLSEQRFDHRQDATSASLLQARIKTLLSL